MYNIFELLPEDIIGELSNFLMHVEMRRFALTCKHNNNLIKDKLQDKSKELQRLIHFMDFLQNNDAIKFCDKWDFCERIIKTLQKEEHIEFVCNNDIPNPTIKGLEIYWSQYHTKEGYRSLTGEYLNRQLFIFFIEKEYEVISEKNINNEIINPDFFYPVLGSGGGSMLEIKCYCGLYYNGCDFESRNRHMLNDIHKNYILHYYFTPITYKEFNYSTSNINFYFDNLLLGRC